MARVTPERAAALSLLQAVERGRRLDVAWEEAAPEMDPEHRGWVQEAVFGTVRLRGRLDHLLDLHVDRGLQSVAPPLLPLLRLGAYQLLYMDGVPDYAAVSQAVGQARQLVGAGVAGLVNGVLRSLARSGGGPERFPSLEVDPVGHLSTWGSHPAWLVRRWLARYGVDSTHQLVEANNRVPRLYFRPLFDPLEEAARCLSEVAIPSESGPQGSGCLRLASGASPAEALERVPGIIQDPAAGWVVACCGRVGGLRIADLCAAPGGKSLALAARGGEVVAADRSVRRLRRVVEGAERLGLRVSVVVADGTAPPLRSVADVVLVDAPCSGTGTLRRHPDARWRLSESDLDGLIATQDRILAGAAGLVRPGGLLVYSTCTLEPEENDQRVQAFLRRHGQFMLEDEWLDGEVPERVRDGPFLRVLPQKSGTDGSFAARLRRRA